uniref:Uncharacterized protein n=1 Tax=Plectus sambesii TaxID=2011161 RepID=A0A914XP66_9BILA
MASGKGAAEQKRQKLIKMASVRSTSERPPLRRKKWFSMRHDDDDTERPSTPSSGQLLRRSGSHSMLMCDEITARLAAAIATWHDIHSNLLRLSLDGRLNDAAAEGDDVCSLMSSSVSSAWDVRRRRHSSGDSADVDNRIYGHDSRSPTRKRFSSRMSISDPDLTAVQLKGLFPDLPYHASNGPSPNGVGCAVGRTCPIEHEPKSHAYAPCLSSCMSEHESEQRRRRRPAGEWRGFVAVAVITVAFSATDANRSPTRKTLSDYTLDSCRCPDLALPELFVVRRPPHDAKKGLRPDADGMDGRKLAEIGLPPVIIDTFAAIDPTDRGGVFDD